MANIEDEVILMSDITSFTEVMARSGLRLSIRRATRDARALLKDFFEGVSLEDLRFRFLTAMLKVSDEQIAILVDVDHKQTEDFLAFIHDGPLREIGRASCRASVCQYVLNSVVGVTF